MKPFNSAAFVLGSLLFVACNSGTPTAQIPTETTITPADNPVGRAAAGSIVINEVAWSGTKFSSTHEWIELRNTSATAISLTGWKLLSGTSTLDLTGSIPANGYYLVERTEAATNITANLVSTTISLSNSGGQLILKDNLGNTIDTAGDGGAWPAGTASTLYKSMERKPDGTYQPNDGFTRNGLDFDGNPINGTPKANNSPGYVPTPTPSPTPTPTPTPVPILAGDVLINEVVVNPKADRNGDSSISTSDEYIELYVKKAGLNLTDFVLEMNDATPATQTVRGIYFGNNGGTITKTKIGDYILILDPTGSMDDTLTLNLKTPSGTVIDSVVIGSTGAPDGTKTTSLTTEAISRVPNGTDTNNDAVDFKVQRETAGFSNAKNTTPRIMSSEE